MSSAPAPELVIHIDGGSRGNPGPSGFGVHAANGKGVVVAEHFGFIGVATNNVAEYQALVHAFRLAAARGARRIEIRSDSELVVKQMNGVYKVKHPDMITLWRQGRFPFDRLIGKFPLAKIDEAERASLAGEVVKPVLVP